MLHPEYPLHTERLELRPLTLHDVEALFAYQSRPDVCRYVPYEPRTREQIAERITSGVLTGSISEEGDAVSLGVTVVGSEVVIGDVMLRWRSREHKSGEIGYAFNPDYSGNGYATEACRALLPLAFDGLGLHRIFGRIDARNIASANVLRRLGMRQEALLVENEWFKGEWTDEIDFGLLAREWRAAVQPPIGEGR
jgi:RimJ/RimL family protein N-acetyltransferase